MPARALFILLLVAPALAGCASGPTPCAGATDVCIPTSDGWALRGATWSANDSTRPWALLVHGLNEDHHSYDKLAADLNDSGWRVLAIDSRGHGESTNQGTLRDFTAANFLGMEKDLPAAQAWLGAPPALVVGASVGANEAMRYAAHAGGKMPVVLLSPGFDYRGLTTTEAATAHRGAALLMASEEDQYAANTARGLASGHPGPVVVKVWSGKGHGTNLLDDETRAFILSWIRNSVSP